MTSRKNNVSSRHFGLFTVLVIAIFWSSAATSGWFADNLIDPDDGMLDASDYLASAKGFLPVPIIITEPAVGFGLGLAVAYFHKPKKLDSEEHPHHGPPSISLAFGAKTENETYFYGAAHMGVWKEDHIRYTGAVAKVNVNLTFYLDGRNDTFADNHGLGFNINGTFLFQKAKARLKESNWWLGATYLYVDAENTFDLGSILPPEIPDPAFGFNLGGLGFVLEYDDRNTVFTPTKGLAANVQYTNYDKNWGSDFAYDTYQANLFHFTPFAEQSSLGLRLNAQTISGDAPFFAYPFVGLRGIPAMRYQGRSVLVGEAEYLWGVTPRWSVVFFGGVGHATAIREFVEEDETVAAGGLGFRYRLARKLGLQVGVDVARGPEDTAIYLTMGSAWAF